MFKLTIFLNSLIISFFFQVHAYNGGYPTYGPQIKSTAGKIWPKPYKQVNTGKFHAIDPKNFKFAVTNKDCPLLQKALVRYTNIISNSVQGYNKANKTQTISTIAQIKINLSEACETLPHLNMDESYQIFGAVQLKAKSIWGILRGLESLSQLIVPMPNGLLRIPDTKINDKPRFKYRGLMLDSARHFVSKAKILQLIEGMAYNKLNVFHWHISDDSAFPFNSKTFPELSAKGAYRPELTYSPADVVEIVEFARLRGIRVVAEFDTPAHTASWGASHPEIMTKCFGVYKGQMGPLNPTKKATWNFLYKFFKEIKSLFKDKYLHLGGDEVDSGCWESNPQIKEYLTKHKLDTGDLSYLYMERFSANISKMGWKQMVWQEAMTENSAMKWPAGTIAQVWFNYKKTMAELTKKGHKVIMSQDWYLYVLDTGGDWEKFYKVEPTDFPGTKEQKKHVIGGEACLWSEFINEYNVLPTTFPRVSAVAERLWSKKSVNRTALTKRRLQEQNCRMIWRGIEARPANGYGLC